METNSAPIVVGRDGLRGHLRFYPREEERSNRPALIELQNGQQLQAPPEMLERQADGSYYLALGPADLEPVQAPSTEHTPRQEAALVVPVVEEQLSVEKKAVVTGRARITKHIREHEEVLDEPLLREEVAIERIPINKVWEGPPPPPRYEAETLVLPLLEEVLVVEKRLMLKEELRIRRIQKTVQEPQTVVRRSEEVTVERIDPS